MDCQAATPSAHSRRPESSSSPPLEQAWAHASLLPNHPVVPDEQLLVGRVTEKRTLCRFLQAFVAAAAIWLLLGSILHGIMHGFSPGRNDGPWGIGHVDGPTREDGQSVYCIDGNTWSHDRENSPRDISLSQKEVSKTFELPLDSELLYILSRGLYSYGNLDIVPIRNPVKNVAMVEVKATYSQDKHIQAAKVCLLTRHGQEHGLGLYTPQRRWPIWPGRRLRWDIIVSIPLGTDLKALSTNLHTFSHFINGKDLQFGKLDLTSNNGLMNLISVTAEHTKVNTTNAEIFGSVARSITTWLTTTNGAITGSYNATATIYLRTTNSAIIVDANLTNTRGPGPKALPYVMLGTSNGRIDGKLSLHTIAKDARDEVFVVQTETINAPFNLIVDALPTDAKLDLSARNDNGRITAKIHPAWEGNVVVSASRGKAVVDTRDFDDEDPKGEGRKRYFDIRGDDTIHELLTGNVRWGEGRNWDRKGSVWLDTSHELAKLTL